MRLNDIANTVHNIVAHELHEEHKCVIKLAKCLSEKGSVFPQDNVMQDIPSAFGSSGDM